MREPIKILVKNDMLTLEGISQYYIALETDNDKFNTIKDLLKLAFSANSITHLSSGLPATCFKGLLGNLEDPILAGITMVQVLSFIEILL